MALSLRNTPTRQEQPASVTSIDDDPALSAARSKLPDLHAQQRAAQLGVDAILDQLAAATDLENEAAALLSGKPVDVRGIKQQLSDAQHRLAVVTAAIGLQNAAIEQAHRQASAAFCRAVGPEHKQLKRDILNALESLGQAVSAERRFIDRLRNDDVLLVHPIVPLHVGILGDPGDPYSNFSLSLKEARAAL